MRTALLTVLLATVVGCSNSPPTAARGPSDKERLQGVWAVELAEAGPEVPPEEAKKATGWRLHVHQDRFALGAGDDWRHFTFAVDEGREPKGLLLFVARPDGKEPPSKGIPKPPPTRGWLYKFDGDKLVLAFVARSDLDSVPPPADFKPEKDVMVLRLNKTNEQPRTDWGAKPADDGKK